MYRSAGHRSQIRHVKLYGRSVRSLTRYNRTMFIFLVAFSSVFLYMTSRMLRNVRSKPLHVVVVGNKQAKAKITGEERIKIMDQPDNMFEMLQLQNDNNGYTNNLHDQENSKLLEVRSLCRKSSMFLLVLIFSEAPMTSLRDLIRQTWCKSKVYSNDRRLACIFLIGQDSQRTVFTNAVKQESLKFNDIMLMTLQDDFRNSTLKLLTSLTWVNFYCPDVRYVLRTEDDVVINMKRIMERILPQIHSTKFVGGSCYIDQPIRNEYSRYYMSFEDYPDSKYPPKCDNMGYILSGDVIHSFRKASSSNQIMPLDDVHVAVLLRNLSVTPKNMNNFLSVKSLKMSTESSNVICKYAIFHAHVDTLTRAGKVWEMMRDRCTGT